ncbi:MAG: hypothetical protein GY694_05140 [Gammaproteobacteria bacterium]|nr:hypothetical protein [Gammaproteobacteria bacterium]
MKQHSSQRSNINKKLRPVSYSQSIVAFVIFVLFSMPAYAQSNYLFPSDIIDQGEQFQYDLGRVDRYENQRQWVYPNTFEFSQRNEIYPQANSATLRNEAYEENRIYSKQNYPNSDYQSQGEHYQYGQFKPNNLMQENNEWPSKPRYAQGSEPRYAQGTVKNRYEEFRRNPFDANTSVTGRTFPNEVRGPQYPAETQRHYDSIRPQQTFQESFRTPYTTSNYAQRPVQRSEYVYPGDVSNGDRSQPVYSGTNPFSFDSFGTFNEPAQHQQNHNQQKHNNENVQIRYVPVPVYTAPGTLPGTIPGVVTPGNMVPGYSHLSPSTNRSGFNSFEQNSFKQNEYPDFKRYKKQKSKQSAFNPFTGLQYNPMSSMSSFSENSNPFDSFYKIYDSQSTNTKPFSAPDFLIPGLSMPSMFSSQ